MWPTPGQQPTPYYWPAQWQQSHLYGYHPAPQETDPGQWAAKAAQWAQQRMMQDQYVQQMTQWQQQPQQVEHMVHPHQPTPELQQHVSPELQQLHQAEQRNPTVMGGHVQPDPLAPASSQQQQTVPTNFEELSGDVHRGGFNEGGQYHSQDDFGTPRHEFLQRGSGGYQNDSRFRGPKPRGFERPPGPHGFEKSPRPQGFERPPGPRGFERPPRPQGFERPPRPRGFEGSPRPRGFEGGPPHRWEKGSFMGEQEDPHHRLPPTESYFAGVRNNDPMGYADYAPPSGQETLPKMDYRERESYEGNHFQRDKTFAGGKEQNKELEWFEREIKEASSEQNQWLYGEDKQSASRIEGVQRHLQPPKQQLQMSNERSPGDQQQMPSNIHVPQERSSFHQHDQEQVFYSQDKASYHQPSQPHNESGKMTTATSQVTISSLRKSPAVIPGLGEYEESPNLQESRDVKHEKESSQPQTTQVIESLGKIVSQLQTLQGLTSSLQLLQTLPKGQHEKTAGEGDSAREAAQRDKEVSEETKRKVAALLANDSDSEGEQSAEVQPKVTPKEHVATAQGVLDKDSSPPAREFDGTFDVKPQVYGTYPTQEQYGRQEEEFSSGYREGYKDNGRYPEYEYPPRSHERERSPDYGYNQPPREYPPDYPYPPEHRRGPVDYGRERSPYDGKTYEGRYERDYPPSSELLATVPPPVPPREGYYDRPGEKERPNITSQMESIDYSHGGGLPNVQTVDYHHGQPTRQEPGYIDPPPKMPYYPPPPSHYDDYPAPPGYGARPYPPYPGGYPPPPHHYPPYGGSYMSPGLDPASIFAAYTAQGGESKRKALPGWLRDALEKMERDKQKKMEKEAKEMSDQDKDSSQRPMWKDELEMEEEREMEREEIRGKSWVTRSYRYSYSKSPFKSDSEEDRSPPPHPRRRVVEEPEDEEEKQVTLIMKIRKMLTEILLEVTSQEVEDVANEVIEEAKNPKLSFQMTGKQKPVSENVLGLGVYGSESESEGNGGVEEERKRTKSKSRAAFGPVLDPQAIAEAFRDSQRVDKDQERERDEAPKERKKGKSSKKESSSDRRSSDDKNHEGRSGTKDRDRDREKESSKRKSSNGKEKESTKVSSKYDSPSSRNRDLPTSSPSTTKSKTSSSGRTRSRSPVSGRARSRSPVSGRARSRSPAKSSDRRHSSTRESKTHSSKSDKKSSTRTRSPSKSSTKSSHKPRSPSSPARKRSRHHSRSPSPARGGSRTARSRSRSPNRSRSTKKSPPRFSSTSKRK